MKISYECTGLINEVLEEIDLYGLDKTVVAFIDKKDNLIKDYLLPEDISKKLDATKNESKKTMILFNLLVELIEQNSVLDRTELACKLIAVRNIAQLTQEKLAKKLNIKPQTIYKYENDIRKPKIERLKEIASACNVDLRYLI